MFLLFPPLNKKSLCLFLQVSFLIYAPVMIIQAYGIQLKRLTADYIELVRGHRNSEAIRNTMEYREIISPEMQQQWFREIDNERNNYMLIFVDEKPIGLISGTQIDWQNGITGNGGIFIWDSNFLETVYPARAAVLMTDLGFYLGIQKSFAKILRDNLKSISFNTSLGYVLLPNQEEVYNQQYELTAERYFSSVQKLRKILGVDGSIKIVLDDAAHPSSVRIAETMKNVSEEVRQKISLTTISAA